MIPDTLHDNRTISDRASIERVAPPVLGDADSILADLLFSSKTFAKQWGAMYSELNMAVSEEDPAGSSPAMADCDVRDVDVSERETHQHPHTPTHQGI